MEQLSQLKDDRKLWKYTLLLQLSASFFSFKYRNTNPPPPAFTTNFSVSVKTLLNNEQWIMSEHFLSDELKLILCGVVVCDSSSILWLAWVPRLFWRPGPTLATAAPPLTRVADPLAVLVTRVCWPWASPAYPPILVTTPYPLSWAASCCWSETRKWMDLVKRIFHDKLNKTSAGLSMNVTC